MNPGLNRLHHILPAGSHARRVGGVFALAAAVCLFSGSSLHADTIIDHSGLDPNVAFGTIAGGNWVGFQFTAPAGSPFDLYEITASWARDTTYTGNSDFQIFTLSGSDLIPFSTPVSIPDSALYTGSIFSFDFATDAVTVDFTAQGLTLAAGTEYYVLGQHNGSSDSIDILTTSSDPVSDVAQISANATLMNPTIRPTRDPPFVVTGVNVPEPTGAFLLAAAALFLLSGRCRRVAFVLPVAALCILFSATARADLIMDESSHSLTSSVGTASGGFLTGFEFTTPTGPSFTLGEIKGSWYSSGAYSGTTDFRLYSRIGADLTPISSTVSIAGIPDTSPATFDFATHATTVDFSSQSILLDPNMAYTILAENNGSGGFMGIHFRFSGAEWPTGPIVGAGRVSASTALDDAGFEDHNDMIFQVFDAAPVPEPGTAFLLAAAGALLIHSRRRRTRMD